MLQLQTKNAEICRISKILVKYNITARVTNSLIILDGEISEQLINELCDSINIHTIQNFINQSSFEVPREKMAVENKQSITKVRNENDFQEKNLATVPVLKQNVKTYDLIYPTVKRGEMYWCDLGTPYGSEQGFKRPVIVIQNNEGNLHSKTTIIVPCSTAHKNNLPVHYHFKFSEESLIDYDSERICARENVVMTEQIQTIDKTRLRKYIGTINPEIMKIIQSKIDISLNLSRNVTTIEESSKEDFEQPIGNNIQDTRNLPKEDKNVNMTQEKLLSFVDKNDILKICKIHSTIDNKTQKILELFGFNFKKKGVVYLQKAILFSTRENYFTLETLSEKISKEENVEKEEIKRLIVARVKEQFKLKKAPTIDFIRLINNFLTKQEDDYEKIDI